MVQNAVTSVTALAIVELEFVRGRQMVVKAVTDNGRKIYSPVTIVPQPTADERLFRRARTRRV